MIQPFFDFVTDNQLGKSIQSFTFIVHNKKVSDKLDRERKLNGVSIFWQSLFKVVHPTELLIVAPAEALGALTACHVYVEDAWSFDCPCHYLRLQVRPESPTPLPLEEGGLPRKYRTAGPSQPTFKPAIDPSSVFSFPPDLASFERSQVPEDYQPEASSSVPSQTKPFELLHATASALFDIRPWTNLLLNEGSFIRAYATYEFWLRQPPSVRYSPQISHSDTDVFGRSSQTW
jgi:hypothetical protein